MSQQAARLFVTGTDTGVGKTLVASALVAAAVASGRRVAAMKPSETGCAVDAAGRLVTEDAARLARLANARPAGVADEDALLELVCPFRYRTPAAPETAALLDGTVAPDLETLAAAADRLGAAADLLVVEGAGGLLVPVNGALLFADLARALDADLVIVARTALGTINHTLLTVETARRRGLRVRGVVFSQSQPSRGPEEEAALEAIVRHGAVRSLGRVPFLPAPPTDVDGLAALARAHLALDALFAAMP